MLADTPTNINSVILGLVLILLAASIIPLVFINSPNAGDILVARADDEHTD